MAEKKRGYIVPMAIRRLPRNITKPFLDNGSIFFQKNMWKISSAKLYMMLMITAGCLVDEKQKLLNFVKSYEPDQTKSLHWTGINGHM